MILSYLYTYFDLNCADSVFSDEKKKWMKLTQNFKKIVII